MTIFATLTPIDLGTNTRVTVRVCASADQVSTGAGGERWWPAIVTLPVIQDRFFDGDFSQAVEPASASIDVRLDVLINGGAYAGVERYDWAGASCLLQRLSGGSLVDVALMQVETFAQEAMLLGLRLQAAGDLFDADVLRARYAGTTGAEGTADLKGQLKPWVFGRAQNVEPVAIDQIDSVFQVSGYGPVQAISAVYERGASFGASVGDFANYAALVAATIPAGRWGTCLAQGMFRLGAPPAGVITCDVDGDNTGGFLRRTGAILTEIAARIGLTGKVNGTSMAALDTAVARNVNIVIREQISFMELAQRMLAPCNAVASVGADGRLIASRVAFGSEQFTLDAQGREMPPVIAMPRQNTSAPYKRVQMGAARSWRVHSFDEIAFYSELIDRGLYDAAATYREGNIVERIDKSRWVYSNPTPSSGNAPPAPPSIGDVYWSSLAPPIGGDLIGGIVAPANANRVPFSRMEGDRGWAVTANPVPLTVTTEYSVSGVGTRFFRASATAAATGQVLGIGNAATTAFKVEPGERLSVQSRVSRQGTATGTWRLELWTFAADGVTGSAIVIASGTSTVSLGDGVQRAFATVPAGRVFARLELRFTSSAAGTVQIALGEPMVASAAPSQTVHPAFNPGPNADDAADVTVENVRTIEAEFPVIEIKQGEAGHTGTRTVPHTAKRGGEVLTGGTWSIVSTALTGATVTVNSSTGVASISGVTISGSYTIRYTHTDGITTDQAVNVSYVAVVSAPTIATSIVRSFSSSTGFVAVSDEMTIQIPTGQSSAELVANAIALLVTGFPVGDTQCEFRWTRETSPGTWSIVGAAQLASPHPTVTNSGGFAIPTPGSVTINRTATGLTGGSTQRFRLEARVSGGNIKTVSIQAPNNTCTVAA